VTAALRAEDLGALAKERLVLSFDDGTGFARVKTRPATAGVELLRAREERLSATPAREDAVRVDVQQRTRERRLGRRLPQYRVAVGGELVTPLGVTLVDFVRHGTNVPAPFTSAIT